MHKPDLYPIGGNRTSTKGRRSNEEITMLRKRSRNQGIGTGLANNRGDRQSPGKATDSHPPPTQYWLTFNESLYASLRTNSPYKCVRTITKNATRGKDGKWSVPVEKLKCIPKVGRAEFGRRRLACLRNHTLMNMFLEYAIPRSYRPQFTVEGAFEQYNAYDAHPRYAVNDTTPQMAQVVMDPADCHFVPQHVYAATVKSVFCTVKDAVEMMRSYGHGNKSVATLRNLGLHSKEAKALSPKVLSMVRKYYKNDFNFSGCTFPSTPRTALPIE